MTALQKGQSMLCVRFAHSPLKGLFSAKVYHDSGEKAKKETEGSHHFFIQSVDKAGNVGVRPGEGSCSPIRHRAIEGLETGHM